MKRPVPPHVCPAQPFTASRLREVTNAALLAVVVILLFQQTGGHAQVRDALPYQRGFLITGNYRVGGVDFTGSQNPADGQGLATGQIRFDPSPSINKTIPGVTTPCRLAPRLSAWYLDLGVDLRARCNTHGWRPVPR